MTLEEILKQARDQAVYDALERHGGKRAGAARDLGISLRYFFWILGEMRKRGLAIPGGYPTRRLRKAKAQKVPAPEPSLPLLTSVLVEPPSAESLTPSTG